MKEPLIKMVHLSCRMQHPLMACVWHIVGYFLGILDLQIISTYLATATECYLDMMKANKHTVAAQWGSWCQKPVLMLNNVVAQPAGVDIAPYRGSYSSGANL